MVACTSKPLGPSVRLYLTEFGPDKMRPVVVLAGKDAVLARDNPKWAYHGHLEDGGFFLHATPTVDISGRHANPYYYYRPYSFFPDIEELIVGTVDAPIWVGPAFETKLIRDSIDAELTFTLRFYSPIEKGISYRTFVWPLTLDQPMSEIYPLFD